MTLGTITGDEAIFLAMVESGFDDIINVSGIVRKPKHFALSAPIAREAVTKFLRHRDLIEHSNPHMNGSECYKIAGYLSYWIATLKPVLIMETDPDKNEILVNEYLAISIAINCILEEKGVFMLSTKIVDDLKYALRYRMLTMRMLPMIFEAYMTGFVEGNEAAGK